MHRKFVLLIKDIILLNSGLIGARLTDGQIPRQTTYLIISYPPMITDLEVAEGLHESIPLLCHLLQTMAQRCNLCRINGFLVDGRSVSYVTHVIHAIARIRRSLFLIG